MVNIVDHREPYRGDGGLRFEPRMKLATDPPVSEAQRRAMFAAAAGHSNLGIPKSVGAEFAESDPGGKLPTHAKDDEDGGWLRRLGENLRRFFDQEAREPEHKDVNADAAPRAAHVAFVTGDGKVLMVRRAKDEKNYPGYWALPGGSADGEETHEAAALRECREELGDCTMDGARRLRRVRTSTGVDHVTFAVPVKDEFEPKLNGEHDDHAWLPATALPEKTHPGVRSAIDEAFEKLEHSLAHKSGVRDPDALAAWIGRKHGKIPADESPWYSAIVATDRGRTLLGRARDRMGEEDFAELIELLTDFFAEEADEEEDGVILDQSAIDPDRRVVGREPVSEGRFVRDELLAFDGDQKAKRWIDDSGHMHVTDSVISAAVVSPYLGSEINGVMKDEPGWVPLEEERKYHLLRDPKELEKGADTFNGQPLLWRHQAATADDHPADIVIGSVGTKARMDGDKLRNDLSIWPGYATKVIEDGTKKSLSCGYGYTADMTPGTYQGQRYDGVMRNIRGNHVALVDQPRVPGSEVGGDSADELLWGLIADTILELAEAA